MAVFSVELVAAAAAGATGPGAATGASADGGFAGPADAKEKLDAGNDCLDGPDEDPAIDPAVIVVAGVALEPKEKLAKGFGALAGSAGVVSGVFDGAGVKVDVTGAGAAAAGFPNENPPKGDDAEAGVADGTAG